MNKKKIRIIICGLIWRASSYKEFPFIMNSKYLKCIRKKEFIYE